MHVQFQTTPRFGEKDPRPSHYGVEAVKSPIRSGGTIKPSPRFNFTDWYARRPN